MITDIETQRKSRVFFKLKSSTIFSWKFSLGQPTQQPPFFWGYRIDFSGPGLAYFF